MANTHEYLKAAQIIKGCPKSKLPIVIDLLRQGGIELSSETYVEAKRIDDERYRARYALRQSSRDKWVETDDPFVMEVRKAYEEGISFGDLYRITGLNKTTVYRALWGERKCSEYTQKIILDGIEKLREGSKA